MSDKPGVQEKKSEGQKPSDSKPADSGPKLNLLDILDFPTINDRKNKKAPEKQAEPVKITEAQSYQLATDLQGAILEEIKKFPNADFSKCLAEFEEKCGKNLKSVLQYMAKHGDEFEPLEIKEREGKFIIHVHGEMSFAEIGNAVSKDLLGKPVFEDHSFKGATFIIDPDKLNPPAKEPEKPRKIIVGRGLPIN